MLPKFLILFSFWLIEKVGEKAFEKIADSIDTSEKMNHNLQQLERFPLL